VLVRHIHCIVVVSLGLLASCPNLASRLFWPYRLRYFCRSQGYRALESSFELVLPYTVSPRSPYTRTLSCSTPAMSGTIYNPIRGPYTKQAFGKFLHKGEDAWLQQPKLLWRSKSDSKGATTVSLHCTQSLLSVSSTD